MPLSKKLRLLARLFFGLGASLALLVLAGCVSPAVSAQKPLTRIGFGSCINTQAHPMLDRTLTLPFDLFILLGDNIYADTTNPAVMAEKYRVRKESAFFQALRKKAPLLATWDDHDFGGSDAGASYPMKVESQKLFCDFMDVPPDSPRRQREGVYDAGVFGPPGRRVQVILLDTRYFRSNLATGENHVVPSGGKYIPHPAPNVTLLGAAQWKWLEEQLRVPAELRVVAGDEFARYLGFRISDIGRVDLRHPVPGHRAGGRPCVSFNVHAVRGITHRDPLLGSAVQTTVPVLVFRQTPRRFVSSRNRTSASLPKPCSSPPRTAPATAR